MHVRQTHLADSLVKLVQRVDDTCVDSLSRCRRTYHLRAAVNVCHQLSHTHTDRDTDRLATNRYSTAGCVTGQSHNSESCHSQGVIIGAKSVYIFLIDFPPQNIYSYYIFASIMLNPFSASCFKLLLFKGFNIILV